MLLDAQIANRPRLGIPAYQARRTRAGPVALSETRAFRKAISDRICIGGALSLADIETLEALLQFGMDLRGAKDCAAALMDRFGSLPAVLESNVTTLLKTPELTSKAAETLLLAALVLPHLACSKTRAMPILSNWASVGAYLAKSAPSRLRVLFLDGKNRLVADEMVVETMLDSVTVRVILGRSLELSCISLLLVATRNDTTPKKNDREALKWLRCQASFVSVIVHDLVLTGNGKISSVDHSL